VIEKAPEVIVDLENAQFNDKASDIRYAREKIFGRIVHKSPDDASQKSKKKKRLGKDALSRTMSIGKASITDSAIEGLSAENITQSGFNDSIPRLANLSNTFVASKAKPRDFNVDPKALKAIGAQNYDKLEDMGQLTINVELAIEKLRSQWKCIDEERLIYLIRKTTINELTIIEERKQVRIAQQEIDRKKRDKLEEERETREAAAAAGNSLNRSGIMGSPTKGGVGFMDRS
jgi:hypothetical protein